MDIVKLHHKATWPTQAYGSPAGMDLYAVEDIHLPPYGRDKVFTGIIARLPPNSYGRIAPKSGLALRQGIDVLAGVIDQDYEGEIIIVLYNTTNVHVHLKEGQAIAQLICTKIIHPILIKKPNLGPPYSLRGSQSFGSTQL